MHPKMRAARGLLASLGASTCLVLAGTLAMATLSTVVAFSGLPGMRTATAQPQPAVLAAVLPAESTPVTPRPVALARPSRPAVARSRASAPASATSPAPAGSRTRPRPGPAPARQTAPSTDAETPAQPSDAPVGEAPAAPSGSGPAATADEPVRSTGNAVGGAVGAVGGGVSKAVEPVAPVVAPIIDETGKVAGASVAVLTEAVAGVLGGLSGQ
jgi:hypothetical protein